MNEELKDRGLKKAVREQTTFRLPSNFTYRTMQKVEEAIRLREKKSERRILLATIAAAIFLIGVSGTSWFCTSETASGKPLRPPPSHSQKVSRFLAFISY